jgi:Rrf2 family transcriptional regulator, iron-sulfur cluster assembly transcription factor
MLLSKSSEYAIRLVFHLNSREESFVRLKEIAKLLDIPYYQLAKVANILIRHEILNSHTGPRGGVQLKIDISKTTLLKIVEPFEGDDIFNKCVLGLSVCGSDNPCPIHEYWGSTKFEIIELFTVKSIKDLIEINTELTEKNILFSKT